MYHHVCHWPCIESLVNAIMADYITPLTATRIETSFYFQTSTNLLHPYLAFQASSSHRNYHYYLQPARLSITMCRLVRTSIQCISCTTETSHRNFLDRCREVNGHGKEAKCSIGIWKDNDTEKGSVECDPCRIKREEKERRARLIYGKEAWSSGSDA